MNCYLLDAIGAGFFSYFFLFGLLFLILASLIEAVVMILMKYNIAFKKAIGDSFLANLASLGIGLLLLLLNVEFFEDNTGLNILVLYLITVAAEVLILYLLNKDKPFVKSLLVCVVMNTASYLLFWLYTLVEA